MQIDIRDINVFQKTLSDVKNSQNRIKSKKNFLFNELQQKQNEVNNELSISNNLLNVAKANEAHKQMILAQKTAQLAKALQQEAAAIATANPIAIAAATTYVAKAVHEEMIAQKEYQKARTNRINMEKRVELVKKAKHQIDSLYENTKLQLNGLESNTLSLLQILQVRLVKGDITQKEYLAQNSNISDAEFKNIPLSNGTWSGEPGNSKWIPDRNTTPKQPYGNEKTWDEILDENNIDGIEFKNGEPDFSIVSEGSVKIKDFSTERDDNFYQADELLAKKFSQENKNGKSDWTRADVKEYRKNQKLTWHERSDMETMDLVPQEVHGNIPHSGGISKAKKKKKMEEENG